MEYSQNIEKHRKIAKYIAIGFGINLVFGETLRNWGDWPADPRSYAFDYLFAVALIFFGVAVRYTKYLALALTSVIWVLTIFLFTWSFIGHVKNIDQPTYGLISQLPLTILIGVLDLVAMIGLFASIFAILKTKRG